MSMTMSAKVLAVLLPVALLGACTSLSDEDKAAINTANQNAAQALETARRAETVANQAAQNAAQAALAANQAAANAQAANEKADRMFQRSLRK